ncbi:protein translocase subunit secF /protein translocase subunit secD [Bacillus oleivorans]|uniref:Multifunctional fusion protein n=1 Tax=Bacillus oleivorans TaxID=1448271 RepID=A0A285CVQ8_9BACI|nr:protein translocase subunit SecDF [Bacillus oleivorans]SNX71651.1 protein translocase subunit secF /protein translocase subunit secD [Bacillus oleivorans]
MVKRSRIVAFFLIVVLLASTMGLTTKDILGNIRLGLDLQGGFEVLYEVKPIDENEDKEVTPEMVSSTAQTLSERIDSLGVNEPSIEIEEGNRIRVQLAGIEDQATARELLATEANISFRDINDNLLLDGSDLVEGGAKQSFNPDTNAPMVTLKLKDASLFAEATRKVLEDGTRKIVIWLDYEEGDSYQEELLKPEEERGFISDPGVDEVLNTTEVMITGNFSVEEAQTLASLLNSGSLPVKLDEVYSTSVGAQFGEQALQKTIYAGIIGIGLIFIFMLAYYRFPGLIAVITLSVYLFLVLLVFDWMNAVLTLPGIAALILGVGMAVDANIITYERIKEEIKVGRSIKAAFQEGNKTSLLTIFDANITTLLAGVVLFIFGTSSVKGFATTLIVSILVSFITAIYGTRLLLGLWVNSKALNKKPVWFGVRKKDIKDIAEGYSPYDLPTRFDKFDFVKHRKTFFITSGVLIAAGLICLLVFRLNLGIDFSSGTRVQIVSNDSLTTEEVSGELDEIGMPSEDIVLAGEDNEMVVVQYKGVMTKEEIDAIKTHFTELYGSEPSVSTVSPTVGRELAKNALYATVIAAIGIIIYVAFRFEAKMGIASVIALLHDAFFIIAVFSILQLEVDITFIASVLTIIGYSINDTIVTFDRIRENMTMKKRIKTYDEIKAIVNQSIRQTLTRSINTVITVVFTVVALYFLGAEPIQNFSLALLVGLIAGTYSSLFIAAQLWMIWKGKELKQKGTLITEKQKKRISDEPQV